MTKTDDKDFISRWSQRKQQDRVETEQEKSNRVQATDETAPAVDSPSQVLSEDEIVAQLPDIDGMDGDSDYSVFLKEGVPDAIRRKAMHKLWRVDPAFAVIDGLDDYAEDFTIVETLVGGLKTAYQVGKGYVDDEDEDEITADDESADKTAEDETAEDALPSEAADPERVPEKAMDSVSEAPLPAPKNSPIGPSATQIADSGAGDSPGQKTDQKDHKIDLSDKISVSRHSEHSSARSARGRRWGNFSN